tara:strand:- start:19660 stop:20577 length:918 start_codon:yes stop_codon:yes gene_type:complete
MTAQWFLRDGTVFNPDEKMGEALTLSRFLSSPRQVNSTTAEVTMATLCSRCAGQGGSNCWSHTGWECFKCRGKQTGPAKKVKLYTKEKLVKLDATKALRDAKREAKNAEKAQAEAAIRRQEIEAAKQAMQARYPQAVSMLEAYTGDNTFLSDIQAKFNEGKPLTDRMASAIINACERENTKGDWQTYLAAVESGFEEFPTGRTTVRGFIRSYKWKDDRFGGSTLKITLVDERGFVIHTTRPKSLSDLLPRREDGTVDLDAMLKGWIEFEVTLSHKEGNFGFGTRPKKNVINFIPFTDGNHPFHRT